MIQLIYSSQHQLHDPPTEYAQGDMMPYPEMPARADQIYQHLAGQAGVEVIEPDTPLSFEALIAVHDEGLVEFLQEISTNLEQYWHSPLPEHGYLYPEVFPARRHMNRLRDSMVGQLGYYTFDVFAPIGKGTWQAALYSATVADTGAIQVLEGQASAVYALCRPPGHHAGYDFVGGYCYLNNAALAASRLRQLGRVAIIDIDYHHGNGTQHIFWDDPDIFTGSLHADPTFEYPYYSGFADEIGGSDAIHATHNIPLPLGTDGGAYRQAVHEMIEKAATFQPSALVIPVGLDTFADDPNCHFGLQLDDYVYIGKAIAEMGLPTLFVQEGGYNVEANGLLAEKLLEGFLS